MTDEFNNSLAETIAQVQCSLVIVQGHRHGFGAGVIWRKNGMILTNAHVVNQPTPLIVLPGGSEFPAKVLRRDTEIDLALLEIAAGDLAAAQVASQSELKIGELVFAVGHPWGQRGFTTLGVLAALDLAQTRGTPAHGARLAHGCPACPGQFGRPAGQCGW